MIMSRKGNHGFCMPVGYRKISRLVAKMIMQTANKPALDNVFLPVYQYFGSIHTVRYAVRQTRYTDDKRVFCSEISAVI